MKDALVKLFTVDENTLFSQLEALRCSGWDNDKFIEEFNQRQHFYPNLLIQGLQDC